MKKLILMVAIAVCGLTLGTSCRVDADFQRTESVDGIAVAPSDWKEVWVGTPGNGGYIDYMYADRAIPQLTWTVVRERAYIVYFKYLGPDSHGNNNVEVQEPLPCLTYEDGYSYQISGEVSNGNLRIVVRTSDGKEAPIDKTMYFRLAIIP